MSAIVTFYSYKGGVGRSMSLANTAVLLAKWGYKTLIVDWDLEAPGLEHFFKKYLDINVIKEKIGVIDILDIKSRFNSWQEALIPITLPDCEEPVHLITSGKRDENYFKKVRNFNIDDFYKAGGGEHVEKLRNEWKSDYDFIFIDSRTGITEIGGICAVQLPDQLVLLFTATDQGFDGTLDVANRALKSQQSLPYDRQKLIFIPILTKFDTQAEFKLSQDWINLFALRLNDIYNDWLPVSLKKRDFIETTKIPYITYFSFGERLPVIEQSSADRTGLTYAYENLAALIANNLFDIESLMISRDEFINKARKDKFLTFENLNIKNKKEIKIFISYSNKDRLLKNELVSHISILQKKHNIVLWSDDNLLPGDKWNETITRNLEKSDIVLLLISPDYLAGNFTQIELEKSISLEKRIIPIMLKNTSIYNQQIADYYFLPTGLRAIEESKDSGFLEVTEGLEKVILSMQ